MSRCIVCHVRYPTISDGLILLLGEPPGVSRSDSRIRGETPFARQQCSSLLFLVDVLCFLTPLTPMQWMIVGDLGFPGSSNSANIQTTSAAWSRSTQADSARRQRHCAQVCHRSQSQRCSTQSPCLHADAQVARSLGPRHSRQSV